MSKQNELKHFGIKGMKWGVWNDETRRRYNGYDKDAHYYDEYKTYKYLAQQENNKVHKGRSLRKARNMAKAAEYMRKADKALKKVDPEKLKKYKREDAERRKALKEAERKINDYLSFTPVMTVNSFLDVYKDMKWDPNEHNNDPDFEDQKREVVNEFLRKNGATVLRVKGD